MKEKLENLIATLPDHPGVYLMKDAEGTVIYVGKAISLKNRVRQYFRGRHPGQPKVDAMVEHIDSFDYVLVDSELEAFILECNLIKEYRPHYNIMLRDDKHYPYIRVDMEQAFPRLEIARQMKKDKARYFGPYFSARAVRQALEAVGKAFPLRTCRRDLPARAGKERPCLNAHMGTCVAPCTGKVDEQEYKALVRQACRFLEGHGEEVVSELRRNMQDASAALQFEKAALYRDRLMAVERVLSSQQKAIITSREDWDILGFYQQDGRVQIQLLVIRGGFLNGSETFSLEENLEEGPDELIRGFIRDYYAEAKVIPQWILTPYMPEDGEALEQWLTELRQGRVYLHKPERGEKRKLVDMACENARQSMEREVIAQQREWERTGGAAIDLARALGLEKPPHRIECYDISNIQGTNSVASMVVMLDGKAAPKEYRRFKIKTVEGANDFASMREVLGRRFAHGLEEQKVLGSESKEGKFNRFPDLVIIDGGPEQLAFAREAMEAAGVGDIPAVGLAKREEWLYKVGEADPVKLPKTAPALHMVQRIRDEAHRFAITYHRSLRGHKALLTQLDQIPGVGPARRKALLKAYPVQALMKQATVEELMQVPGITEKIAQQVYDLMHSSPSQEEKTPV